MKMNRHAELSTGHLSLATRTLLNDPAARKPFAILVLDDAFKMSTDCVAPGSTVQPDEIPFDLHLALRAAFRLGADAVVFDTGADPDPSLPWYGDGNMIVRDGSLLEAACVATVMMPPVPGKEGAEGGPWKARKMIEVVRPGDIPDALFGPRTPVLEDTDYEAPNGVWIGMGPVSVRLKTVEDRMNVDIYVNGHEDDEEAVLRELTVTHDEVREAVARMESTGVPAP